KRTLLRQQLVQIAEARRVSLVRTGAVAGQLACESVWPLDRRASGQFRSAESRLRTTGDCAVVQQRLFMHRIGIAGKSLCRGTLNLVQDRIDVRLVHLRLVG